MFSELRYAVRTLKQHPGFALTAIISIALAIGANSTIFSYADGLLLRPLPVSDPSRLVTLRSLPPTVTSLPLGRTDSVSYPDFKDFQRANHSFEGLAAYSELIVSLSNEPKGQAQNLLGYQVSGNFFHVLGVKPEVGREFRPDEDEVRGRDAVVVLSHDLWTREFGGDQSIAGRRVWLNRIEFTIVGVAPQSFTGLDQFLHPDFFLPAAIGSSLYPDLNEQLTNRSQRSFNVKGRLKPGVSLRAAAQEASALAKSLEQLYPSTNRNFGATANTELEMRLIDTPIIGGLVGALFTVAVVILLIACANIANLMLARGRTRTRELGIRLAIGAGRARLVRLLLTESALIALLGGGLALLVAQFTSQMFSTVELPADVPVHFEFQVDTRVLYFTMIVSAASALIFGLVPAIHSSRLDLMSVMKSGEVNATTRRFYGTYALVVVQIAGTVILLAATAAGRQNFSDILTDNPGFRRDHRLTMRFNLAGGSYSDQQTQAFYKTLVERSSEVPGIKSAALTSSLPLTFDMDGESVIPEGYDFPRGRRSVEVLAYVVDGHYFETLGVPILYGRGIRTSDRAESPLVTVVNQAFAKEFLGPNPIGKRLRLNDQNGPVLEVVGVAVTGKAFSLIEPPVQAIYLPLTQNPRSRMTLIAETTGDPSAAAGPLTALVRSIDPGVPAFRVRTMEDLFERSSVNTIRVVGKVYDSSAALGLLLALVGLYAVVSYQVARRTREIGIRLALGAERRQVAQIFLKQAMTMSLIGVFMGTAINAYVGRIAEKTLGGTPPNMLVLAAVGAALFLTAIAAAAMPARRASRIAVQDALRQD